MPLYGSKKIKSNSSRFKKSSTSRNYRGFRKYKRSKSLSTYYPNVMPDTIRRYLNYCEEFTLDAPGPGVDWRDYKANGMYDPRVVIGGHQPYGLDQLTAMYKYWRVMESTITITPVVDSVADTTPCYVAVVVTDDASTSPTFSDSGHFLEYCNRMGSKVIQVGGYQAQVSNMNQTVSCKWNYKKWLQANPNQEWNWGIGSSADPANTVCVFRILVYSINGNNPATRIFRCSIGYKAQFFTPIKLPES